jgi:hypothetical protein
MPFGHCNAPSTFQPLIKNMFHPFLHNVVFVLLDDILINRKIWESHIKHVDKALQLLHEHYLFLSNSKCTFGAK